jgi:hypothetical protein
MGLFDNNVAIDLTPITCCACGMTFGVPPVWDKDRRDKHDNFHCPNGHSLKYHVKSEADKLRDDLAREKHRAEQAQASRDFWLQQHDAKERSLRATKAVVTSTKKRIVAGQCPCCSHKFKDLAVHMKSKHPDYNPDKAIAAIEAKA